MNHLPIRNYEICETPLGFFKWKPSGSDIFFLAIDRESVIELCKQHAAKDGLKAELFEYKSRRQDAKPI